MEAKDRIIKKLAASETYLRNRLNIANHNYRKHQAGNKRLRDAIKRQLRNCDCVDKQAYSKRLKKCANCIVLEKALQGKDLKQILEKHVEPEGECEDCTVGIGYWENTDEGRFGYKLIRKSRHKTHLENEKKARRKKLACKYIFRAFNYCPVCGKKLKGDKE